MSLNKELATKMVDYLNSLVRADRRAIGSLVDIRIPCTKALGNHPTCQVMDKNGGDVVGLVGVLNGLCGVDESNLGAIGVIYDNDRCNASVLRFKINPDANFN